MFSRILPILFFQVAFTSANTSCASHQTEAPCTSAVLCTWTTDACDIKSGATEAEKAVDCAATVATAATGCTASHCSWCKLAGGGVSVETCTAKTLCARANSGAVMKFGSQAVLAMVMVVAASVWQFTH